MYLLIGITVGAFFRQHSFNFTTPDISVAQVPLRSGAQNTPVVTTARGAMSFGLQLQQINVAFAKLERERKKAPPLSKAGAPDPQLQTLAGIAQARQELLQEFINQDPYGFYRQFQQGRIPPLSVSVRSKVTIPDPQSTTITSPLVVVHSDDFEHERSEHQFFITDPRTNQNIQVYPQSDPDVLQPGAVVRVSGIQMGTGIVSHPQKGAITLIQAARPTERRFVQGPQRTAVFLFSANPNNPPMTKEQIRERFFGGGPINSFFQEASYGKLSLTGDVYGWYPLDTCESARNAHFASPSAMTMSAVQQDGISLGGYSRIVQIYADCGGSGVSTLGTVGPYSVASIFSLDSLSTPSHNKFDWRSSDSVIVHELGHGIGGIGHAGKWICGGGSVIYGNCSLTEYGNLYDVMGVTSVLGLHFNAFFKEVLGWLDGTSITTITTPGRYSIGALEFGSGVRAAKIQNPQTPGQPPYYLEFRNWVGFDGLAIRSGNFATGVFINQPQSYNTSTCWGCTGTRLFNVASNPLGAESLDAGEDFEAGVDGIHIDNVQTSGDSASFSVSFVAPNCGRGTPNATTSFSPDIPTAFVLGEEIVLPLTITNTDSKTCGNSNFRVTMNPPPGWNAIIDPDPGTLNIAPLSSSTQHRLILSPPLSAVGSATVTITLENLTSGRRRDVSLPLFGAPRVTITSPESGVHWNKGVSQKINLSIQPPGIVSAGNIMRIELQIKEKSRTSLFRTSYKTVAVIASESMDGDVPLQYSWIAPSNILEGDYFIKASIGSAPDGAYKAITGYQLGPITIDPPPQASITLSADVSTGQAPLAVRFTSVERNLPSCRGWDWSWGDNTASSGNPGCPNGDNPIVEQRNITEGHTYRKSGTYTTTISSIGTTSNAITITVSPPPPTTLSIRTSQKDIISGDTVTISWQSSRVDRSARCRVRESTFGRDPVDSPATLDSDSFTAKPVIRPEQEPVKKVFVYTFECPNEDSSIRATSVGVTVRLPPVPKLFIRSDQLIINTPQPLKISWGLLRGSASPGISCRIKETRDGNLVSELTTPLASGEKVYIPQAQAPFSRFSYSIDCPNALPLRTIMPRSVDVTVKPPTPKSAPVASKAPTSSAPSTARLCWQESYIKDKRLLCWDGTWYSWELSFIGKNSNDMKRATGWWFSEHQTQPCKVIGNMFYTRPTESVWGRVTDPAYVTECPRQ